MKEEKGKKYLNINVHLFLKHKIVKTLDLNLHTRKERKYS